MKKLIVLTFLNLLNLISIWPQDIYYSIDFSKTEHTNKIQYRAFVGSNGIINEITINDFNNKDINISSTNFKFINKNDSYLVVQTFNNIKTELAKVFITNNELQVKYLTRNQIDSFLVNNNSIYLNKKEIVIFKKRNTYLIDDKQKCIIETNNNHDIISVVFDPIYEGSYSITKIKEQYYKINTNSDIGPAESYIFKSKIFNENINTIMINYSLLYMSLSGIDLLPYLGLSIIFE